MDKDGVAVDVSHWWEMRRATSPHSVVRWKTKSAKQWIHQPSPATIAMTVTQELLRELENVRLPRARTVADNANARVKRVCKGIQLTPEEAKAN